MTDERPLALVGDPDKDPVAFLKEFVEGEISYNPELLSQAYLRLAEQSDGIHQLTYTALSWAVAKARTGKRIKALEKRVEELESRLAGNGGPG